MALGQAKKLGAFLGDRWLLVVEPSVNYRASIKQFLANLKVKNLKLVNSVAEAKREMLTRKVGLFIVEWALEDTNGLQFCRSLRKEEAYRDVPFLLLSVENLKKDVVLAAEVEVDGYLLKPFSYEDFCAQIAGLISRSTKPNRLNEVLDRADQLLLREDVDAAAALYKEARDLQPESARALCGLARIAQLKGNTEEALRLARAATQINTDFIEGYRLMLEIAEGEGDRAGVIQAASILHTLSPENPRYTLILARTYLELNQLEGSERFFRKTVALSPKLADAYKGLGNVYMAQEEYEKAMKSYKRALDLDADDLSTLNSLGLAHVRMEQYKEGIECYMVALRLDPRDARVLFNLAHAHEKKGELERAKWYYSQALVHKPGFEKAERGLERLAQIAAGNPDASGDDDDDTPPKDAPLRLKRSS